MPSSLASNEAHWRNRRRCCAARSADSLVGTATSRSTRSNRARPRDLAGNRRRLGTVGLQHRREILNRDFIDYAVGNKIFVYAWAEETLDRDVLVFLDSDTIFTGEPEALDLADGFDAAIRPAHSTAHNSSGPGHPMDPYWKRVYNLLGVVNEHYVTTELGTTTRAYFSAGLIAVRRQAGLFRKWKADFLRLTDENCLPESGIARSDEISLAATMLRAMDRVTVLDGRYNYLIFKRANSPLPGIEQLEDLVHIHYRKLFSERGFLRRVRPASAPTAPVLTWIEQYLPFGQ